MSVIDSPEKGRYSIGRVGQNHIYTACIRCFWQGNHHIYGHIWCIYTVLANPTHVPPINIIAAHILFLIPPLILLLTASHILPVYCPPCVSVHLFSYPHSYYCYPFSIPRTPTHISLPIIVPPLIILLPILNFSHPHSYHCYPYSISRTPTHIIATHINFLLIIYYPQILFIYQLLPAQNIHLSQLLPSNLYARYPEVPIYFPLLVLCIHLLSELAACLLSLLCMYPCSPPITYTLTTHTQTHTHVCMHAGHGRGNRLVVKKDMVMEIYMHTVNIHTNTHMYACMQNMVVEIDWS